MVGDSKACGGGGLSDSGGTESELLMLSQQDTVVVRTKGVEWKQYWCSTSLLSRAYRSWWWSRCGGWGKQRTRNHSCILHLHGCMDEAWRSSSVRAHWAKEKGVCVYWAYTFFSFFSSSNVAIKWMVYLKIGDFTFKGLCFSLFHCHLNTDENEV